MERVGCACGKYCSFAVCKVKFISRHVATLNIVGILKRKVSAFKYTVRSFYKFSNNEYRPMGIQSDVDWCAARAGYFSPLYNAIRNIGINNSNLLNVHCPLQPGDYYVKDLNVNAGHLPSIIPAGRYLINSSSYKDVNMQSKDWMFNVSLYFSVTNYGIQDLNVG